MAIECQRKIQRALVEIQFPLASERKLFIPFCLFFYLCCKSTNAQFTIFNVFSVVFLHIHCSFMKDSHWSACSVTCGEGIRTKQYRCKIFLELSQTLATLHNDSFCFGPKPAPQVERCILEPCSMAYGYEESYPR